MMSKVRFSTPAIHMSSHALAVYAASLAQVCRTTPRAAQGVCMAMAHWLAAFPHGGPEQQRIMDALNAQGFGCGYWADSIRVMAPPPAAV